METPETITENTTEPIRKIIFETTQALLAELTKEAAELETEFTNLLK